MTGPAWGADDGSAASFVRGLTIGALLGAAVAGSSLWTRRRRARRARSVAAGTAVAVDEAIRSDTDAVGREAGVTDPVDA